MRAPSLLEKIDYTAELNTILEDFFARNSQKAISISPYYHDLWAEIARLMSSGGKRLRPKMTILAYQAFGGKDVQAILPIAAAQELLHLGMLIHDDIIDRDYIRYGVDNIAGGYDKMYKDLVSDKTDRLHYAHSSALLAGDLMISGAYQLMTDAKVEATKIIEVQRLFGKGIFEVVGGELIDTESAFREFGEIKSETVALYKTASYTFIVPMLIGAMLADASKADQAYLRLFAENLGIAFQLRDDIIGVFGSEAATGKSTSGDIREGKRTYMVEQLCTLATKEQKVVFDHYFGDNAISSDEVELIRDLLVSTGAKQKTEEAIARYEVKARSALESLTLDPISGDQLEELITIATKREK